jgi:hypothetical protein
MKPHRQKRNLYAEIANGIEVLASKRTKRPKKPPQGYDSWFEYDLHQRVLAGCKCHTAEVEYTQVKKYIPDFIRKTGKFTIYIEAKGRFRDRAEARKYVDVKKGLKKDEELVFVFWNPNTPMPGSAKRRDGTRLTHGAWADLQGFRYFTETTTPAEWSKQ